MDFGFIEDPKIFVDMIKEAAEKRLKEVENKTNLTRGGGGSYDEDYIKQTAAYYSPTLSASFIENYKDKNLSKYFNI